MRQKVQICSDLLFRIVSGSEFDVSAMHAPLGNKFLGTGTVNIRSWIGKRENKHLSVHPKMKPSCFIYRWPLPN